jgi:hypothetical protein
LRRNEKNILDKEMNRIFILSPSRRAISSHKLGRYGGQLSLSYPTFLNFYYPVI